VLAVLLVVTRDGSARGGSASANGADLGLHRPGFRRWLAALPAPRLFFSAGYGSAWGAGALALADGLDGRKRLGVVGDTLAGIASGTVTYQLGEEIGWSGSLLPRLAAMG
jgi:hypothetical protein